MTDGGDTEGRAPKRHDAPVPSTPAYGFPVVDESAIPPRPPLPSTDGIALRDQLRAKRGELEEHVQAARDQFDQANERIKERTGRDLILAIVIGLALGAVLLASLLLIKELFVPIALALALLGVFELSRALRTGGRRVDVVPQLIAGALVVLAGWFAPVWLFWVALFVAVAIVIVWRLIAQMVVKDGRIYGDVLQDVVIGAFVQIYVPFLAAIALILLRQENGEWWVLAFIAIAVAADTGAYASGLLFGKHPMAPRISPKKTWEGFAGAVVVAIGVGIGLGIWLLGVPWWAGAVMGAAILASATLGDLGESMLKRDIGIKDMSSWLPGHGGILDRLDSILPSTLPALIMFFVLAPWVSA